MPFSPTPLLVFSSGGRAGRAGNAVLATAGPALSLLLAGGILWGMARFPEPAVRTYPLFSILEIFLFLRAGPLGAFVLCVFASFAGMVGMLFAPDDAWFFIAHGGFLWALFHQLQRLDDERQSTVSRWEEGADRLAARLAALNAEEEKLLEDLEDARERAKSYGRLQYFADDLIGAHGRDELVERARRSLEGMFPRSEAVVTLFRASNAPAADDEWGRRAVRLGRPQLFPSRQVRIASLNAGDFLFVPLKIRDSVIGWATVEKKRGGRSFRLQDLRLALIAGDLFSLSVGNAERYAQIESLAIADGLTGVFTRGYFNERLREEFAKARHNGWMLSLLLIDIDHFKKVNDTHGHHFGDEVLRWLARQVTAKSRDTDFVARYGGEEFIVLMPNTGGVDALAFAERLRRAVADAPFCWESAKLKVTVSGGVAALSDDVTDEEDFVRRADESLYAAKTGGRNTVVLHG